MTAIAARRGTFDELSVFELRLALRGRAAVAGALVYGVAMAAVAATGLSSFRQVGAGVLTPASTGLLEAGLLIPTLVALVAGGAALHGDRDEPLRDMLRASGVPVTEIVAAKLVALFALAGVVVATGTAVAGLVLAGAVRATDVAPLAFLLAVVLLATSAAASCGLLVSALARDRAQALMASVALWGLLAIGVDLLVLGLASALHGATAVLLVAAALDPIEAARIAGLLVLGADAHVLGDIGAYVATTVGPARAVLVLMGALAAWTALPAVATCALLARREAR